MKVRFENKTSCLMINANVILEYLIVRTVKGLKEVLLYIHVDIFCDMDIINVACMASKNPFTIYSLLARS